MKKTTRQKVLMIDNGIIKLFTSIEVCRNHFIVLSMYYDTPQGIDDVERRTAYTLKALEKGHTFIDATTGIVATITNAQINAILKNNPAQRVYKA